jgi:hypothetical protein
MESPSPLPANYASNEVLVYGVTHVFNSLWLIHVETYATADRILKRTEKHSIVAYLPKPP